MSEMRYNPVLDHWLIVAPGREDRRRDWVRSRPARPTADFSPDCPLCPGNEADTGDDIARVPAPDGSGGWWLRGIGNKYPVFGTDGRAPRSAPSGGPGASGLFRAAHVAGVHEVIVETPVHSRVLADRTHPEVLALMGLFRERYLAAAARPDVRQVSIFQNHGSMSGASLEHPHSQLVGIPVVMPWFNHLAELASEYHAGTGTCMMCDTWDAEEQAGVRVVGRRGNAMAFIPYAPAYMGEVWLVSREHRPHFGHAGDGELRSLAVLLPDTLRRMRAVLDDPDYNYAIHSAPAGRESSPAEHWFLRITPRRSPLGGFELGTSAWVVSEPPEDTAGRMRSVLAATACQGS